MSAIRTIYHLAGLWNEHWGRIKTLAICMGVLGAVSLVIGGVLVHRYGWIGAVAIIVGGLFLVGAAGAFLVQLAVPRLTKRRAVDATPTRLDTPPTSQQPADPREALNLKFRYDEEGSLRVGVENRADELNSIGINLLAPRRYERAYVARIEQATGLYVQSGAFDEVAHQLVADGPEKSVRWTEPDLTLFGHTTTEWKFFMPYVEGDPIYFKLGGDSVGGWTDDLIAITPPTLAGSKATKEFFPGVQSRPSELADDALVDHVREVRGARKRGGREEPAYRPDAR